MLEFYGDDNDLPEDIWDVSISIIFVQEFYEFWGGILKSGLVDGGRVVCIKFIPAWGKVVIRWRGEAPVH